jgi:hypothetical protein
MANETVTKLGDVHVLTPAGRQVRLGESWSERPVLLAMIRHFG